MDTINRDANLDADYGYDEFTCESCVNFEKCEKDPDERCETWYEEGRD